MKQCNATRERENMSRQVNVEGITESQQTARSFIKDGVFLVDGSNRSALYDTSLGNVYSLNRPAADAIRNNDREDTNFWSNLETLNLVAKPPIPGNRQTREFKEMPPMGLDFAWLEITDDCNQHCLHCYGNFSPRYRTKTVDVFTYTEWLQTIEKLKAENCWPSPCTPSSCTPNVSCDPNTSCHPFNCYPATQPCMPDCAPAPGCNPTGKPVETPRPTKPDSKPKKWPW